MSKFSVFNMGYSISSRRAWATDALRQAMDGMIRIRWDARFN
jgi:hypothetical protein